MSCEELFLYTYTDVPGEFWEFIVSVILRKKSVYVHVSYSNRFWDRGMDVIARIKECQDALRWATRHFLIRVTKYTDVHGIFEMYYTR
jgi:hypothetical protein